MRDYQRLLIWGSFLSLWAFAIQAVLFSCATTPGGPPTSECMRIARGYCAKGAECIGWPQAECEAAFAEQCPSVAGISSEEADLCLGQMAAAGCADPIPDACIGIASPQVGVVL